MLSTKHFIPICLLIMAVTLACNRPSSSAAQIKRYHLKGKVVSVDKRANMVNVDGEDIPGFMAAMVMPYQVKPASELDKLSAGDAISAEVVVQDDNSWLENVVVTGKASGQQK
jgi:protein SCO1/2